jgi:polyisoprenoid-binding protein YceI
MHTAGTRVYQESAVRSVVKHPGAVIISLALAACGAPPPKPPAAPAPVALPAPSVPVRPQPPAEAVAPAAARYRIDPAQSELRVLVYRAGAMASLGHNHVISTHSLQGWAAFEGDAAAAAFAVTVPVADFAVDDPGPRTDEGADFADAVTEEAKSGTRHNMLGPAVLNAADFPVLRIRSVAVAATGISGSYRARLVLEVAGHESSLVVPFQLDAAPHRLIASGELTVSQSSIGLTPFSIFLGALKVQDDVRVKFKFVAVAG